MARSLGRGPSGAARAGGVGLPARGVVIHGGVTEDAVTRGGVTRSVVTRGGVTRGVVTRGVVTRGVVTRGVVGHRGGGGLPWLEQVGEGVQVAGRLPP